MIHLIIGNNTIGKTLYLKKLLSSYLSNKNYAVLTNLIPPTYVVNIEYDDRRINIFEDITYAEHTDRSPALLGFVGANLKNSTEFASLVTILCKQGDILLLDEPCMGLTNQQKIRFIQLIDEMRHTFKEVYIVTHYEGFLNLGNLDILTVKMDDNTDKLSILKVSKETADEVLDGWVRE